MLLCYINDSTCITLSILTSIIISIILLHSDNDQLVISSIETIEMITIDEEEIRH